MTVVQSCSAGDQAHEHEFPDDWIFGGADGMHPGADPRYMPTHYEYMNRQLQIVHITHAPLCDMQALEELTEVASWGFKPVAIMVRRPGEPISMLPYWYDPATDEIHEGMLPL